jgi:hypothetical protein
MSSEELKDCPFCKEEIRAEAIKCKHCGSDLTVPVGAASNDSFGYALLLTPAIATALIWLWVANMNMLQDPGSTLTVIGIATIIATATMAAVEAQKLGFGQKKAVTGKVSETGPIGYFLGMVLLWIVVYPLYLYQRSKKGKKNLVVGGILIAIIFAGSWYMLGTAINSRINEIRGILSR